MSFWQKLLGRFRRPKTPRFPLEIEILPGKLTGRVFAHDLELSNGKIPCWSYVTGGRDGGEFVFTLRRDPEEEPGEFSKTPLSILRALHALSSKGQRVQPGEWSELTPGLFGRPDFAGLTYLPAEPIPGVEASPLALAPIVLNREELEAVKRFGAYRVTTLLGDASRYYPCPPWSDRRRPAVMTRAALSASLLGRVPRAKLPGATAALVRNRVTLRVPKRAIPAARELLQKLSGEVALALLTDPDPEADARLVWKPGQPGPRAIHPPGSEGRVVTGGALFLAAAKGAQDGGRIFEDGFGLTLGEESWGRLRRALESGAPTQIASHTGDLDFALEWQADPS